MEDLHDIEKLLSQVDECKEKIAKERNKLRKLFFELEGLLCRANDGLEFIDSGIEDIRAGIDRISEEL